MSPEQIAAHLRALDTDDHDGLQQLGASVRADAMRNMEALASLAQGTDASLAQKAIAVLAHLGDDTFVALLRAPAPATADAGRRLWRLRSLVQTELELRDAVRTTGLPLLDDRTVLPRAGSGAVEHEPPPSRVCDEAYLLLRELLKYDERAVDQMVVGSVFLQLPVSDKDAAIDELRTSGTWMDVFER